MPRSGRTRLNSEGERVRDERSVAEAHYERWTTLPLIFCSFLFIVAYSVLVLDDLSLRSPVDRALLIILILVWILFIVDYFVRLGLASNKRLFVRSNVLDMLSMLIPFLRPFLLLVYLARLRWFQGRSGSSLRARVAAYAGSAALMYIYVLSLAVFAAERHAPGASILSYGDAIWWAFETISTVGYGDMIPVTVAGRFYAVLLMLGGMIIVGATTAVVLSLLNERLQVARQRHQERQAALAQRERSAHGLGQAKTDVKESSARQS